MKVRNFCILYAEYYLMPDNISANGRNFLARDGVKGRRMEMMKAPDNISANGRNFLARDGVKGRRIIYRQMDEIYESVLDAQREAMMKPRSVE